MNVLCAKFSAMNIHLKRGLAATTAIALGLGFSTVGASAAFAGVTSSYSFKVDSMTTTNGTAVDTVSTAGDDGGFVAVTPSVVIRDGDLATYTYSLTTLADVGPTDIGSGTDDEIFTDLATETAYVLPEDINGEYDHAVALDADGNVTATEITFSEVIPTENGDSWGAASGAGQIAFWNWTTGNLYVVSIPSGKVSIVSVSTIDDFTGVQPADNSESDGALMFQSVLEYDCTGYSIVTYDTDDNFSRFNLADATTEVVLAGDGTNIDVDNLVVSPSADRWYFHAEESGETTDFGIDVNGMSEQLVSADATSTVTADACKDAEPELPNTGVDVTQAGILAGGALALAVAGVALVVIRRRNA